MRSRREFRWKAFSSAFVKILALPCSFCLLLPGPKQQTRRLHHEETSNCDWTDAGICKKQHQQRSARQEPRNNVQRSSRSSTCSCDHGPVCWAYNLKTGCKNATSGKPSRCVKGFHVCANCHKAGHSVVVCRGLAKE